MPAKKPDVTNFLDDDEDISLSENLSGRRHEVPVTIPPGFTLGQAVKDYLAHRSAYDQSRQVTDDLEEQYKKSTRILIEVMKNQDPEVRSYSITGGITVTQYEDTVGNLIGGEAAAIIGIKEDGLEDRLVKEKVMKGELNSLTKELIEKGEAFPAWLKPFGVPKISMTTSKKKGV